MVLTERAISTPRAARCAVGREATGSAAAGGPFAITGKLGAVHPRYGRDCVPLNEETSAPASSELLPRWGECGGWRVDRNRSSTGGTRCATPDARRAGGLRSPPAMIL